MQANTRWSNAFCHKGFYEKQHNINKKTPKCQGQKGALAQMYHEGSSVTVLQRITFHRAELIVCSVYDDYNRAHLEHFSPPLPNGIV